MTENSIDRDGAGKQGAEPMWPCPKAPDATLCRHCGTELVVTGRGRWKRLLEFHRATTTPQGHLVAPTHRCPHGGRRGRRG